MFRHYEYQLFELMHTVWNAHNPGRQLSLSAQLKIDFYAPKPPLSDQIALWDIFQTYGVFSPVDVLLQVNPDIKTREEALKHLEEVRQEKNQPSGTKAKFAFDEVEQ